DRPGRPVRPSREAELLRRRKGPRSGGGAAGRAHVPRQGAARARTGAGGPSDGGGAGPLGTGPEAIHGLVRGLPLALGTGRGRQRAAARRLATRATVTA